MSSSENGRHIVKVGIIYPADPAGVIPGGIDTFIRGIVDWAPDDISFSLIGITTDSEARPVGRWTRCELNRNSFEFLPVYAVADPGRQPRIPATLQFTIRLPGKVGRRAFDVLESHRIEPLLPYLFSKTPKNLFLHQNMEVIYGKNSDIRWRHFPWLYHRFEDMILSRLDSVFVVREDAVQAYRDRYPQLAHRFSFLPTWMDPEVFFPASRDERAALRKQLLAPMGIRENDIVIVFVGRLDKQKDPLLLIEAFKKVLQERPETHLLLVGDGVLRPGIEADIRRAELDSKISFAGLVGQETVAKYLRASDLFALSSAYEGMPMCVLEAMGSGLPIVATDVGEIRRIVTPGVNGEIARSREGDDLAEAILSCVTSLDQYTGTPSLEVAGKYVPERILEPVYEKYRRLAYGREV